MRIALALFLASSSIAICATPFKLTITDPSGAGIAGATVFIHWDSAGSDAGLTTNVGIKQDLILATDKSGSIEADLPVGFYDVFVSASAFTPACRKVRLRQDLGWKLTLSLPVDPLVGDELKTAPKVHSRVRGA